GAGGRRVERALLQGAQAHGFDTDLWTLPRVAEVIWRLTGVGDHPGHVWWLLRRHDWGPQGPTRRAAAGGGRAPPAAPPSATTPRSPAGGPRSGPASKGGGQAGRMELLPRRVRLFADPADPPHLGAARAHPA